MDKLKYLVFILICSLFMVSGVSAESEYYEFVKLENYGSYGEIISTEMNARDAIELDTGFLVLSSREDAILVYNNEGVKVNTVSLDFKPDQFLTIDDKNYVVGFGKNYEEAMFYIVEVNDDATITDMTPLTLEYNWTIRFAEYFETDEYIYLYASRNGYGVYTFLKLKRDFSSIEEVGIENLSEEEKTLLSDFLYAEEQGTPLEIYNGGIIYSAYVLDPESEDGNYNHVIYYYQAGQVKWTLDGDALGDTYDIAENHDGNILLLTNIIISSDGSNDLSSYIPKTYLHTINPYGTVEETFDVSEYFDAINGNYNWYMALSSYYKINITDNFVFITGPAVTSQKSEQGYDIVMYFKKKTPEVEDEKVPETSDNVYSYLVMLAISGLALTTLSYKKRYN